ncbi:MAG: outer membrane protein assembly factor BamA [Candidatus Zixiibacteriota bacterium]
MPCARIFGLVLAFFTCCLSFCVDDAQAQSTVLSELRVEGQSSTDPQLIKNVSGLVVGRNLTREDIQRAVHQVWGLNLFADVRVEGEQTPTGLSLAIHVRELPRLSSLSFKGNKELKEKDFSLALKRGQTVGPNELKEAERTIRAAYAKKGFFLVDVRSELVSTAVTGEVDAVFQIKENNPVKVARVEFMGNAQVESEVLTKKMSNKPHGFFRSIFGGGHFNREKYADDKRAVIDAYRQRGYLDAVILSDTVVLNDDKTRVTIQMTVSEGPRYYFGTTTFTGMSVLSEAKLRRALQYRSGDVFDQEAFDKSEQEIYNAYMEEGYLYARVINETRTQDTMVNVAYEISEGVPAHVNLINITGNVRTKDKVIRRELAIYPGQVFRRSALQRSLRNVMLLNYFSNVTPDFSQLPDGRVDLTLNVEEKPTGQIQVGGGYSEQDHLVGTVNLGIPNLFGGGQSANLMLEFGNRRQSYSVGFTEPWFMDTPTSVGFDIQKLDRIWDEAYVEGTDDFTQKSTGISTRLGRRLRWPDDYFSVYWSYRWEDQKYTDFSAAWSAADQAALTAAANGVISATSFSVVRDARDLPEFATKGSRASYRLEFGGGALGGDWSYTKHNLTYSRYRKLWKGLTLAPTWNLGVIQGGTTGSAVPYSEQFYAGGIRSDAMIRGYDDRSILAVTDTSRGADRLETVPGDFVADLITGRNPRYGVMDTVRGRAFLVMNAQITFPIVPKQIHGLLFFDAGNVWYSAARIDPADLFTSYGFGFRITVPGVGMLGFDFGIPLRGDEKGKLKPHFQFGGSF